MFRLKDLSQTLGMLKRVKKNKCLERHSLIKSIFIPYEYLASLEKARDLTSTAPIGVESNGSDENKGRRKGDDWDAQGIVIPCFLRGVPGKKPDSGLC